MDAAGHAFHSPLNISLHLTRLATQVGIQAINTQGKHKKVREARTAMVVATFMYELTGDPFYVHLVKDDPPDAIVMGMPEETPETLNLTKLEISTYRSGGRETFLEQLKRTKAPLRHILDEKHILLYDVPDHTGIDFEACRDYLNKIGAPFPVWVQHISQTLPDTIASITFLNPTIWKKTVNVGNAAYELKQKNMPPVIFPKRVGTVDKVRLEPSRIYDYAPWEDLT
ncbi:MAG: hypothetical protein HYZ63_03465 [Candidatus Andersenbacteria bacterium]|nr:hypothetical protein [Candidatus Andersenbacteria bacterium]